MYCTGAAAEYRRGDAWWVLDVRLPLPPPFYRHILTIVSNRCTTRTDVPPVTTHRRYRSRNFIVRSASGETLSAYSDRRVASNLYVLRYSISAISMSIRPLDLYRRSVWRVIWHKQIIRDFFGCLRIYQSQST